MVNMTAKKSSLLAQTVSCIWISAWSAFKFLTETSSITIADIVMSGVSVSACFSPIYISIIFDKIIQCKELNNK